MPTFQGGFFLACTIVAALIAWADFQHAVTQQEGKAYVVLAIFSAIATIWFW